MWPGAWVMEDTRVPPLWHHQKYIKGAATTHVTGKETKELESIYHTTKPNEDFLFQIGPCWQYNKYPDGNWKVLIVTPIISNIWADVVTSVKHLDAFLCHFSSTSWLCFSFNLTVVYEALFLPNIKAHCMLPSTFFPLPSPSPTQKRDQECCLNERWWITQNVNEVFSMQLFQDLKSIWKILSLAFIA